MKFAIIKKMIRYIAAFLFALIFTLVACGDDESSFAPRASRDTSDETRSSSSEAPSSNSKSILIDTICGDLWCGSRHDYRVMTGLDAGAGLSGYWFAFNDASDSGASKIIWPVEMEAEEGIGAFDPVIDYCDGICGQLVLDRGAMDFDPYVGIAFNVGGFYNDTTDTPADVDVTEWEGLCIAYYLDVSANFQLWPRKYDALATNGDVPTYSLPASDTGTVLNIPWAQFRQAGWGGRTLSGEKAAKELASIRIMIQHKNGTEGYFDIKTIGRYNSCK